jgi:uncharacterized protein
MNADHAGFVVSVHRYPVKSMMGEELQDCEVAERGLVGDRAYALVDTSDGKVASAKNPRKWAALFEFHAAFVGTVTARDRVPEVRITTPNGTELFSDDGQAHLVLSKALGRQVRLNRRERGQDGIVETTLPNPWTPKLEEYWPDDVAGLAHSGVVTDEAMPEGTFFDLAPVHVLTTATLDHLSKIYPAGQFDARRFRPNMVVQCANGQVDRPDDPDRRRGPVERHRPMPALRDDHLAPEGPAKGHRNPTCGCPAQRCQCGHLRFVGAGRARAQGRHGPVLLARIASSFSSHSGRAMPWHIRAIYRYPVKGLSAERLGRTRLSPGEGVPQDRRFALVRPGIRFDPAEPEWLPKTNFLMLMRDEKLAELRTHINTTTDEFTIEHLGRTVLQVCLATADGRWKVEGFFEQFLGSALNGTPRLIEAAGHMFSDAQRKPNSSTYKYVSLVNLASIRAVEGIAKAPVDPIRFRANVYFDGVPPWAELDWVGSEVTVGSARLKIVSPTTRCAATTVNPETAQRDLNTPSILQRAFGHITMGIYAEVVGEGTVAEGDPLTR